MEKERAWSGVKTSKATLGRVQSGVREAGRS